ncbi:MAG TPA: LapA family protein [Albitalea sp.]|uniref:LapA family protein n=1 Tax=Piscinibacter sp. TaxID=1903157 RepID=UPI002ED499FB
MRFRTLFLFVVVALTVLFALLNWPAFTAPTTLSLVFGTVQAPVGLIMLGVVFVLGAMCLAYLIYVQGTALLESRRHAKELQAHRELVERAESSRFTELHNFVNAELQKMEQMQADSHAIVVARIEQMEQRTRLALQETGNSLSNYIGELEGRIDARRGPNDQTAH